MYNKVILIGRLVAAPELHKTSTDKSVARVTVAVNRRYKDQNGERETDFVNMDTGGIKGMHFIRNSGIRLW